jgi:hypothetical protein
VSQRFDKRRTLLKELFQLDQPDLDFGFQGYSSKVSGFDLIYVNGDDTLEKLKAPTTPGRCASSRQTSSG